MAALIKISKSASAPLTTVSRAFASFSSRNFSAFNTEPDLARSPSSSLSQNHSFPLRQDPKDRNVQWVFLGCPGVGKGTYASRLSNLLGVPHIATGDLVREELNSSGPLASQEILEGVTDIDLVVNLKLREEALLAKCLGRRICSQCGGNYNIACIDIKGENGEPGIYMDPLPPPPQCAEKLIQRADDTEEVVKARLRIYNESSRPVEGFYRSRGKLLEFSLPGGIPESWPKLLEALNLDDHEVKRSAAA
ncbi:Adenylate kinase 1, chloroplastic [Linum perenne]